MNLNDFDKSWNLNWDFHKSATWHPDKELIETQNVMQYGKSTYFPSNGNFTSLAQKPLAIRKDKDHFDANVPSKKFKMKTMKNTLRVSFQKITIFDKGSSYHIQITIDKAPTTASK